MYSAVQSMPGIGEAATAERQKALDMVAGQILQPDPEGVDTFSSNLRVLRCFLFLFLHLFRNSKKWCWARCFVSTSMPFVRLMIVL